MRDKLKMGTVLKKIRVSKGITQKQITQYTGISQSNYSKYEMGKIEISNFYLISILEYLDISLQEFIYLCNDYNLSEKEAILKNFFNIPFHKVEDLMKIKNICTQFLTHTYSNLIEDVSILCDALIVIYRNNDYKMAREIARPIWDRLSNNNELYVYDLYFINAILYIFPNDEILHIKDFTLRAYDKYQNFPNMVSIFINIHLNIALVLIENCLYKDALHILEQIELLCKNKKLYFQLAILLIRKGICLSNLENHNNYGDILIEEGKRYLMVFSENESYDILMKEIELYTKIPSNI